MSKESNKNSNASIEVKIIAYYRQPNSMSDTIKKFSLTNRYQLKKILAKHRIAEHSEQVKRALQKNNMSILTSKDYNKYLDWFKKQGYRKEDFIKKSYNK